jgi:hypothetical protein
MNTICGLKRMAGFKKSKVFVFGKKCGSFTKNKKFENTVQFLY